MGRFERIFVVWTLTYMVIYVPALLFTSASDPDVFWRWIAPLHFLGMAQNILALILTIRDLYKRPFPHANQKVTWALLITWTGGIGWIIYIFKYALKPRPSREDVISSDHG